MTANSLKFRAGAAFSLTETVIALGLFSFCILGVLALIPVGMNSARSVVNESTVINLAEAFFGAWQVAPENASTFPIPGMFPANQQPVPLRADSGEMYFLDDGTQTDDRTQAAILMDYDVAVSAGLATINLDFVWPAGTETNNVQQRRSFTRVMPR
jgi:Tfp pilus assembly protein PilV